MSERKIFLFLSKYKKDFSVSGGSGFGFYRQWQYLADMKGYYHYCSRGLRSEILFNSAEEFVAGMNRIAVCIALFISASRPVAILAFCLMDNHFHFILYGSEADCDLLVANYKKLTAMWISKYRGSALSESIEVGHWFVKPDKVGEKIAYVLRNPVAAGLRVVPHGYRWSSANLMFSDCRFSGLRRISELSGRAAYRICHSAVKMPEEWLVADDMIWPGSYVDFASAENTFRTIGAFMYALNNNGIDKETEEEMMADNYSLPDSEVRLKVIELIPKYFHKEKLSSCSAEERLIIARLLKKELKCNSKQLARVLHLEQDVLTLTA